MHKVLPLLLILIFASFLIGNSYAYLGGDLVPQNKNSFDSFNLDQTSELLKIEPKLAPINTPQLSKNFELEQTSGIVMKHPPTSQQKLDRYLIFGSGSTADVIEINNNLLQGVNSQNGFFSVAVLSQTQAEQLKNKGYNVMEDIELDFHAIKNSTDLPEISQIGKIIQSDKAFEKYNYNGSGVNIAIVDTGVDFSNPDMQHSLARDQNNIPIMLDADGQGIILTNATFIATLTKME